MIDIDDGLALATLKTLKATDHVGDLILESGNQIEDEARSELCRIIGLRHLQHQKQRSQARRQDVQTEIREIVQMLHTQGICPSVPRVASLLKSGSLREWNVINNAVFL